MGDTRASASRQFSFDALMAGSVAIVSKTATFPLNFVLHPPPHESVSSMVRDQGPLSLFRGNMRALYSYVPRQALLFASQRKLVSLSMDGGSFTGVRQLYVMLCSFLFLLSFERVDIAAMLADGL